MLLRNEGKARFTEIHTTMEGMDNLGMVTGALWTDFNADGWLDLIITQEYGPIRVWRNDTGTLVERTEETGLLEYSGWFNGISAGDVDNDGDIDYVVSNFGLNTKYHASKDQPVLLYYGDFDGSGKEHIIEAEFESETLFPVRGRGCSSAAMPHVAEKFETFKEFAIAPLEGIYPTGELSNARRFSATTLESVTLINDGSGKFSLKALPRLAQISPMFGTQVSDLNGDGNADIFLTHNFFTPQIETGRMDGGMGLVLLGDGKANFTPLWPNKSGIIIPGDAKAAIVLDYNKDGRPDVAVSNNDSRVQLFKNTGGSGNRFLSVSLKGNSRHSNVFGSRVTVVRDDGVIQTSEIYGSSGYLSQNPSQLFFGLGPNANVKSIAVVWPDGSAQTEVDPEGLQIDITRMVKAK